MLDFFWIKHLLSMQGHKVGNFMTPNDILTLDLHLDVLRRIKLIMR